MESITIQQQQQQQQFVGQNGPVEFKRVQTIYPTGEKLICYFSAPTTGVCKPESGDMVGIFKVGWSSLKDMKCKKMVVVEEGLRMPTGQSTTTEHVVFESYQLPTETQQYYQFVYIKNGDVIRGASKPFTFEESEYYPTMKSTIVPFPTQYKTKPFPVEPITGKHFERTEGEVQGMITELRQREEKISSIRRQLSELKGQQQWLNVKKPEELRQFKEQSKTLEAELEMGLQSLEHGLKTMTVEGIEKPEWIKYSWQKTIQEVERKLREQHKLKQEKRHGDLYKIQIQIRQLENLLAKQQQREFEQQQREYQQIQWQIREFETRVQGSKWTGAESIPSGQCQEQQVQQVRKLESFLREKLHQQIEKRQKVCQQLEERIKEIRRQLNEQQLNEFQYVVRHHQQLKEQIKQVGEQYWRLWEQVKPTLSSTEVALPEKYNVQLRQQLRELEEVFSEQQKEEEECLKLRKERLQRLVAEIEMDLNNTEFEHQEIVARWQSKYQHMPEYGSFTGSIMQQQRQFEHEYEQKIQKRIEQLQLTKPTPKHWQHREVKSLEEQIAEFKSLLRCQLNGEYPTTGVQFVPKQWIREIVQKLKELESHIRMEKYETVTISQSVYTAVYESVCGQQQPTKLWLEKKLISLGQLIKFYEGEYQLTTEQSWIEGKMRFFLSNLRDLEGELVELKKVFGGEPTTTTNSYKQYITGEFVPKPTTTTYKQSVEQKSRIYQLTVELLRTVYEKATELKEVLATGLPTTPYTESYTEKSEIVEKLWQQVRNLESELEELKKYELEQPSTIMYNEHKQHQELIQQRLVDLEQRIVEWKKINGEYKMNVAGKFEQIYQHVCELETLWRLVKQQQKEQYLGEESYYPHEQQILHIQQRQLFRQVMRLIAVLETICWETTKISQKQQQHIPSTEYYYWQQVQLLQKIRTLKRQVPVEQHQITLFLIKGQLHQFIMHVEGKLPMSGVEHQCKKFKQMLKNIETRFIEQVQIEDLEEQLKSQFKFHLELQQIIKSVEQYLIEKLMEQTFVSTPSTTTTPRLLQHLIRLVRDLHYQVKSWDETIFEQEYEQGKELVSIQLLKELVGSDLNNNVESSIYGGLWKNGGEIESYYGQPQPFDLSSKYNRYVVELINRYITLSFKPTSVEQEFRRKFEQLFIEQSKLGQQIRACVYEYIQMNGISGLFGGLFGSEQIMRLAQHQPRFQIYNDEESTEENLWEEEQPKGTWTIERIERTPFQTQTYKKKFGCGPVDFEFGKMSIQDEIEQQLNKPTFNVVRSISSGKLCPEYQTRPEEQYKLVGFEVRFPEKSTTTIRKPTVGLTGLNGQCQLQRYSHVQKEMKQGSETVVSEVEQIQFVICPLCGIAVNKLNQPEFELHVNSHFTD